MIKKLKFLAAMLEQNIEAPIYKYTLFLYKNIVFPAQAEYSYFSVDFRLKIFL